MNQNEEKFLVRASTTMALIREGINTTLPLAEQLGYRSGNSARSLINKLKARGWVEEEARKCATLRLTEAGRRAVRHVTLVVLGKPTTWREANP
jgi:hypothetical protein